MICGWDPSRRTFASKAYDLDGNPIRRGCTRPASIALIDGNGVCLVLCEKCAMLPRFELFRRMSLEKKPEPSTGNL